jgi:type IV pilus assembly protein PilE
MTGRQQVRRSAPVRARARGFSLIELLTAMVISGILVGIAVAGYSSQVRKSRRTEAKAAMLDLAGREERNLSTINAYSAVPTELGYSAAAYPMVIGNGYYSINVVVVAPAAGVPAQFTITATPVGDQLKDTGCASFTVDQQGNRLATDSGGVDATADCWR